MTAQTGRAFVLQAGDGGSPETFATVAGLRATSMTINNELVDITNKDSMGWRELLADAGVRNMSVSASGVFKADIETSLQPEALSGALRNFKLLFEDGADFTGAWIVESLEYQGDHNDSRQYTVSLQSSGPIAFTAAA